MWNFYNKDKNTPYTGNIRIKKNNIIGTILAPSANIIVDTTINASVISNEVSNPGGEIHKSQMKEDVEMNDKTEIKTDKISYKKYYRQMGILGTLGGAMWIFYWVMEKVLPAIKKGHTLTNVINLIVSLGTLALIAICITKMISTVGKRDTNDELTQQTTAKVNQTFITFLFTIACLFISVMTLFSDILGRFKVTLNEYVITGLIWFCYAVYNFIGLYFESKFDDDEN